MKRISSSPVPVVLCLLALFVALPAAAQSANGDFTFQFDNGSKAIQFNVKKTGSDTKGQMTFTGMTEFSDQDVDGSGELGPNGTQVVTIKIEFDCMVNSANRAAASGLVTESSIPGLVGRRGLLTVEDNGEGSKQSEPDRFTWGLYRQNNANWTASDAELVIDPGVGLTWFATDAERNDDTPVSSVPVPAGDCRHFSLGSYAVEDLIHGSGNIQVRP
jgi:hypothetical protein